MSYKSINWDNVEFKDEKRFLSNMYPCKVEIDGIVYQSSENYYMAMKFDGVDEDKVKQLQECTPLKSKNLANKWKEYIRDDWDGVKVSVMRKAVRHKFDQNEDLKRLLLATGDSHLEERNDWNDTFWGTCNGKGDNNLGILLMQLRSIYKALEL